MFYNIGKSYFFVLFNGALVFDNGYPLAYVVNEEFS